MPIRIRKTVRGGDKRPAAAAVTFAAILALSGCMNGNAPGVTMAGGSDPTAIAASTQLAGAAGDTVKRGEQRSAIIDDLRTRQSVLPGQGACGQIANGVLTANKGPAAAELRVSRLKAEAKSKNWLPSIGPVMDLTSLGALAASILVEQVLFDNGKRKAERAYAAADVEVAAVSLSEEMNKRVYEGLNYYVSAQRANEQARLAAAGVTRMQEYGRIMGVRVSGGLSDRSEERVIQQKISQMQAGEEADKETAATAMAELNVMVQVPVAGLSGLCSLSAPKGSSEPLAVLRASGEGRRTVAEAKMARAGLLPGLKASATAGKGGVSGGLRVSADNALGFGTGSSLAALEASQEVATQRTESARDDASRRIVALERQIANLQSQQGQGAGVLEQTASSLKMFTQQYKYGRRPLMELVGMFETYSALEREQASVPYDIALLQLQIGNIRGVLVDGTRM
ncbi:TolC family protein [Pseudorhodobacter sp.]|uniref:TolC family protein n=1 Tax=Pseudorhodobacter sp. TaxID=1934400 RepID=UPI002649D184|nr:TolC family protein [Pseudorhodobacter sp.]MDN5786761.1 TolC family protein [Pseudorhodobacter sp.]